MFELQGITRLIAAIVLGLIGGLLAVLIRPRPNQQDLLPALVLIIVVIIGGMTLLCTIEGIIVSSLIGLAAGLLLFLVFIVRTIYRKPGGDE